VVTHPADPARSGGHAFAIVLALVFLTVLGSSVGFVAGRQVKAQRQASRQSGPAGGDQPAVSPSTAPPPTGGIHCPAVAEQEAGPLIQVLYIETSASEVWICRDRSGSLWYQARTTAEPGFTDNNSILLPKVRDNGDGSYLAVNSTSQGTTKYFVSKKSLTVQTPDRTLSPEPVISAASG
jgi:hypothetical protein